MAKQERQSAADLLQELGGQEYVARQEKLRREDAEKAIREQQELLQDLRRAGVAVKTVYELSKNMKLPAAAVAVLLRHLAVEGYSDNLREGILLAIARSGRAGSSQALLHHLERFAANGHRLETPCAIAISDAAGPADAPALSALFGDAASLSSETRVFLLEAVSKSDPTLAGDMLGSLAMKSPKQAAAVLAFVRDNRMKELRPAIEAFLQEGRSLKKEAERALRKLR